ncbi:energy transducer TonB [Taibaiella soli]|uniref:TonB C-terminal domain-containing protein n=1 Tax=Taibaiella soli TaxID=1649169 RepID=A0A2W2AJL5_9BACT|nr:energy transducer TonB [Taibaiella soli]PZF73722.1 hypothetical protein DN068_06920 [Taibaiella soli]
MKIISTLLISFCCIPAFAQKHNASTKITRAASFRGDTAMFQNYIQDHTRYPEYAREHGIEGTVITRAVVNETGQIEQIAVLRGIGGGCDSEAARVVKGMPPWQPALYQGKPVKAVVAIPVSFRLE